MNAINLLDNPEEPSRMEMAECFPIGRHSAEPIRCETSECSVQVNMESFQCGSDSSKARKKERKKESKRRKKQKKRMEQKSAKICLAEIISKIYSFKTTFEREYTTIEICLWQMMGGDKFHDFLNQAIQFHVSNVQRSILAYMDSLLDAHSEINFTQNEEFFLRMVDRIYEEYLDIKEASAEIEKIINLFMRIVSTSDCEEEECHQLDKSTFRYLIETNETIKSLISMCEQKVSIHHYKQVLQLKQLGDLTIPSDHDYSEFEEECMMERSTEIDEEELLEEKQAIIKEEGKRRRRKNKASQQEISLHVDDVIKRIGEIDIVGEERDACNVSEGWVQSLRNRLGEGV